MEPQPVQETKTELDIPIGSIVALRSHPYFKDDHNDLIHISGEPTMISPLMIVTEVLLERKASFEEHTGLQLSDNRTSQCRCIWYSLKSHQFEEAWLSSRLLRKIHVEESKDDVIYSIGTTVVLRTGKIELGKKKASFKQFSDGSTGSSIAALLSFCSPTMHIVGNAKHDLKDPLIDSKTGLRKRWVSDKLVKCKYFNPHSDKLSEMVLPIEALAVVRNISSERLDDLKEHILAGTLFKIPVAGREYQQTIVKPIKIVYKGAYYFLECKDYVENITIEVPIDGTDGQFGADKETELVASLPKFEEVSSSLEFHSINESELKSLDNSKCWRIKYKDYSDVITTRTIYSPRFLAINERIEPSQTNTNEAEKDEEGKKKDTKRIPYIKAFCFLRRSEARVFRIDRILTIDVLDMEAPSKNS